MTKLKLAGRVEASSLWKLIDAPLVDLMKVCAAVMGQWKVKGLTDYE